jgi:hypothetical protein
VAQWLIRSRGSRAPRVAAWTVRPGSEALYLSSPVRVRLVIKHGNSNWPIADAVDIVPYLFYLPIMNWTRAIDINKDALTHIIAGLVALLAAHGQVLRLPLPVYQMLLRILYPAESAVRRLIVIVARGLVVLDRPSRPMPQGLVIAGGAKGRASFQLFDQRKTFGDLDDTPSNISGPRIRMIEAFSPRQLFLAKFVKPRVDTCSEAETLRLRQRLSLLAGALENLPREAKRMVRWQKRRAAMENPAFIFPLRPGPPPGHQQRPREDIDNILRECHALAWMALRDDTS